MPAVPPWHPRVARFLTSLAIVVAAVTTSCKRVAAPDVHTRVRIIGGITIPVTPAPTWEADYKAKSDDATRNAYLADSVPSYGRGLTFDAVDGAGDEQRLLIGPFGTGHLGPLTRIEPQVGSYLLTDSLRQAGRVIARIINKSNDSTYAPLSLTQSDTVYWWIEQRGGRLVSAFVSVKTGNGKLVDSLEVTTHASGQWSQGVTRWMWTDAAAKPWGTCGGGSCCGALTAMIASAVTLK